MTQRVGTIDLTPTWGEVGNIVRRLIQGGETKAIEKMDVDLARAFAAAQALQAIQKDLPDDLREKACAVINAEMTKQGHGPDTHTKGKEFQQ
ncbi:hypothetical protein GIW79_22840 [Pseudomonas sp. PA-7-1E]|jgi:hypothetical protein|uniref:hypothetical protein n=1 Tax=Gammaproteobacteria TaxID=1236 RepID=UPI0019318AFE|nr:MULTISPECIES: hypothetical protein [Gammaproteobacteria]HCR3985101.1 hypothetical protein [Kluyvera ascorbata]EIE9938031.1 hypothetical protein [Escherichia coli]MBM0557869.1 hypothetical protein [Escherichia coli]MCF4988346.1 hypothetical protein [Pseudomonas gessardii]MCF5043289.1 hypothetical protein [Pseudomonas sp. PA-7-1E]